MTIKGFDYFLTETGVHEQFHEGMRDSADAPSFIVFCDAVSATDGTEQSRDSRAAATLAEQTLTEFLNAQTGTIDETVLQQAFQVANTRLLELYDADLDTPTAVSGVVMSLIPSGEAGQPDSFLVAGVGDIRIFRIDRNHAEAIFKDPQTPEINGVMGAEERSLSLHNAMGLDGQLRVATRRVMQNPFQRYVIASYGAYKEVGAHKLHGLGLLPHDPLRGAGATLKSTRPSVHGVRLCTLSYEQSSSTASSSKAAPLTETTSTATSSATTATTETTSSRPNALMLGGAAAALLIGLGFLWTGSGGSTTEQALTNSAPALSSAEETAVANTTPSDTTATLAFNDEVLEQLRSENAVLRSGLDQARNELKELMRRRSSDIEPDLAREQQARAELEKQLAQTRTELKQLMARRGMPTSTTTVAATSEQDKAEIAGLQRRLNTLGREKQILTKQLGDMKQRLDHQQSLLAASNGPQSDVIERYQQMEDQLTKRLDQLSAENNALRERERQAQEDFAQLQQEHLQLQQRETQAATTSGEVDLMAATALEEERAQLAAALTTVEQDNVHLREALAQNQAQVSHLEQILAAQRAELEALDPEALTAAREEVIKLQAANQQAQARVSKLEQRLSRSGQRAATKRRQAEIADLKADIEARRLADEEREEENRSLREQLTRLRVVQTEELAPTIASLESTLEATRDELATTQTSKLALERELAALQTEGDRQLNELRNAYETALTRAQREAQQTDRVDALLSQNRGLQAERLGLLQDKAKLMERLSALTELQPMYEAERQKRIEAERALKTARATMPNTNGGNSMTSMRSPGEAPLSAEAIALAENARGSALMGPDGSVRLHQVQPGDTLSGISMRYYGTARRWEEIYSANRDQLPSKNQIRVGTQLVIPE